MVKYNNLSGCTILKSSIIEVLHIVHIGDEGMVRRKKINEESMVYLPQSQENNARNQVDLFGLLRINCFCFDRSE